VASKFFIKMGWTFYREDGTPAGPRRKGPAPGSGSGENDARRVVPPALGAKGPGGSSEPRPFRVSRVAPTAEDGRDWKDARASRTDRKVGRKRNTHTEADRRRQGRRVRRFPFSIFGFHLIFFLSSFQCTHSSHIKRRATFVVRHDDRQLQLHN